MPELPEVETVARTLAPQVCGRSISNVEVLCGSSWEGPFHPADVSGRALRIAAAGRRGKLLLLHLEDGDVHPCPVRPPVEAPVPASVSDWPHVYAARGMVRAAGPWPWTLAFHLRMTGRLFVHPRGAAPEKHSRIIFTLDNGSRLFFDDARKFGRVRLLTPESALEWSFWRELGPEPLEMTDDEFAMRFKGRTAVKAALMDQKVVAGVGNIYADESLFRAGIRPDAPCSSLSQGALAGLHGALCGVLLESIRECGSSIRDYRTARGDAGAFQNRFRVYGRAGLPCAACGAALKSARIGGRTTVWCRRCQH